MPRSKAPLQEKINKYLQDKFVYVVIWILFITVTSIVTFISSTKEIISLYDHTIGYKQSLYNKISQLNTRIHIGKFEELLGQPIIVKQVDKDKRVYIFANPYYFVQAETDHIGQVLAFAVTSRKEDFKPKFSMQNPSNITGIPNTDITLNESTFYSINGKTNYECDALIAPRSYIYSEAQYLGGQSEYQSIFVAINSAGNMPAGELVAVLPTLEDNAQNCKSPDAEYRNLPINTFMLSTDSIGLITQKDFVMPIVGVHPQDINLLR